MDPRTRTNTNNFALGSVLASTSLLLARPQTSHITLPVVGLSLAVGLATCENETSQQKYDSAVGWMTTMGLLTLFATVVTKFSK